MLDSDNSVFNMKLTPISGDLSLESLLLKTPSVAEFLKTNVVYSGFQRCPTRDEISFPVSQSNRKNDQHFQKKF
jgi:hypothetical protein